MRKVIDVCVFHEWTSTQDLAPYLSDGWRDLLLKPSGVALVAVGEVRSNPLYVNPMGAKALSAYPDTGRVGSDFNILQRQMIEDGSRERIVLAFDEGLIAMAYSNHYVARVAAQAAND